MIKIAHIDDCNNFRYIFMECVKAYNSLTMGDKISLHQYNSGEDFLNAKADKMDLVILDGNMPGLSGGDVARILFKRDYLPVILFCSAMVSSHETLLSIIPKSGFKISELIARYHSLKGDVCDRNRFDIQARIDTYA